MDFKSFIHDVPDFPKQGILYRDISPLLRNPEALSSAAKHLAALVRNYPIDKVVAVESRGFIFGSLLAHILNAGFVMVRRQNKLPRPVESLEYTLEYGNSIIEIHPEDIEKGENVLIHDDVIATGGTADAASRLVEKVGGNIAACAFLVELRSLGGREKLDHYPFHSLVSLD